MNNVTSRPLVQEGQQRSTASVNQPIAVAIWLLACVTTWQLVQAVTPGMDGRWQVGIGIALQAIFTVLERPVLRGKANRISALVLGIDTLVNAGGIYPFALRMSATPTAAMVSQTFNLAPQMSPAAAFVVSLILGFLLAAAPEATWRWRG